MVARPFNRPPAVGFAFILSEIGSEEKREAAGVRAVCAEPIPAALRDGVDGTARDHRAGKIFLVHTRNAVQQLE